MLTKSIDKKSSVTHVLYYMLDLVLKIVCISYCLTLKKSEVVAIKLTLLRVNKKIQARYFPKAMQPVGGGARIRI